MPSDALIQYLFDHYPLPFALLGLIVLALILLGALWLKNKIELDALKSKFKLEVAKQREEAKIKREFAAPPEDLDEPRESDDTITVREPQEIPQSEVIERLQARVASLMEDAVSRSAYENLQNEYGVLASAAAQKQAQDKQEIASLNAVIDVLTMQLEQAGVTVSVAMLEKRAVRAEAFSDLLLHSSNAAVTELGRQTEEQALVISEQAERIRELMETNAKLERQKAQPAPDTP